MFRRKPEPETAPVSSLPAEGAVHVHGYRDGTQQETVLVPLTEFEQRIAERLASKIIELRSAVSDLAEQTAVVRKAQAMIDNLRLHGSPCFLVEPVPMPQGGELRCPKCGGVFRDETEFRRHWL